MTRVIVDIHADTNGAGGRHVLRQKNSGGRSYLQIVENRWEKGKTKQRVVATLGRLDELQENGKLDSLLHSGARFAEAVMVLDAHRQGDAPAIRSFLAILLRKELQDRLESINEHCEWAEILRDVATLQHIEVEHEEKRFLVRSELEGCCGAVFRAAGVAIPPTIQKI